MTTITEQGSHVIVSEDDLEADGYSYKIDVYTGDSYGAGTDANVLITIYGEDGDSGKHLLDKSDNNFERGMKDNFNIVSKSYLGPIKKINIGHDNSGLGAAWFVDKVTVEDVKSREVFEFPCNRWFSKEEDDGLKLARDLTWSKVDVKKEEVKGHHYTVHVFTGDVWGAGTDANILITLYGTKGDSGEQKLDKQGENNFERAMKDTFKIESKQLLGTLYKVRVGHDNTGWGAAWYLDKIVVEDDSSGEVVEFECDRWFATDADDGLITRELMREGFVEQTDSGLETVSYTVTIQTGNVWGAGTDANILVTLYGTAGESDELVVQNEGSTTFEKGMEDTFQLECSYLDVLTMLRIGHDNTGWGPGWYLDKVTVKDPKTGEMAVFPCNKWLAADADDGLITRKLIREGLTGQNIIIDGGTEGLEGEPLGLENRQLPDECITASSHAKPTPPASARLNNAVAWYAGDTNDCWLQIDLGRLHCVTSVASQGNPEGNNDYVKQYRLKYSQDGENWTTHEENGNQIFHANVDHCSVKTNDLQRVIVGRYVRFCPEEWHCWPCMRVEVYGVPLKEGDTEVEVVVTEQVVIKDEETKESIPENDDEQKKAESVIQYILDEERKMADTEYRRKNIEEKKKKIDDEMRKLEDERKEREKKKEEERKHREEETRKKQEEDERKRKEEEERRELEEQERKQRVEMEVKRIGEEHKKRLEDLEKLMKDSEEKRRKEMEERKKSEDEELKRWKEERNKKEEEAEERRVEERKKMKKDRKRWEEERKNREEEVRRRLEEQQQKKDEERKLKEDEFARIVEEEKNKFDDFEYKGDTTETVTITKKIVVEEIPDDEKKNEEEEERRSEEEERQRKREDERRRIEEEEKKRHEETDELNIIMMEMRRKAEDDVEEIEIKEEEEEKQRKKEAKRIKEEEEKKRREDINEKKKDEEKKMKKREKKESKKIITNQRRRSLGSNSSQSSISSTSSSEGEDDKDWISNVESKGFKAPIAAMDDDEEGVTRMVTYRTKTTTTTRIVSWPGAYFFKPIESGSKHATLPEEVGLIFGLQEVRPYGGKACCDHLKPEDPSVRTAQESSFHEKLTDESGMLPSWYGNMGSILQLYTPFSAIRDDDIEVILDWEKDGTQGWKRIKKSRDCEIWKGTSFEGGPPVTKAIVTLNGVPYKEAVDLLSDWKTRKDWDKTFDNVTVIDTIGTSSLIHCPVKKREFVLATLEKVDTVEPYFASAWRNTTHPNGDPPRSKQLKLDYLFSGLVIRPIDDGTQASKITILCQVKGVVPSQAKGTFLAANPGKWMSGLKKFHARKSKESKAKEE